MLDDYKIISSSGFLHEELLELEGIYGKDNVVRYNSFNATMQSGVKTKDDILSITTSENINVPSFIINESNDYDDLDEIELSFNIILINVVIKGLIQSDEYTICIKD